MLNYISQVVSVFDQCKDIGGLWIWVDLPATCNVAFRLLATPSSFLASHQ